jgi:hypothetical protein
VRAIIFSLFMFSCTGSMNEYVDTFWSKDEQVNSCFPLVKEYWAERGETIHFDNSGWEMKVVEDSFCLDPRNACIDYEKKRVEIASWIVDESKRYCDVVAHEAGHGIGYEHEEEGVMMEALDFFVYPFIMPPVLSQ